MLPKPACVGLIALLYLHFYITVALWNLKSLDYLCTVTFKTVLEPNCILMPLLALNGRSTEYKLEYISILLT